MPILRDDTEMINGLISAEKDASEFSMAAFFCRFIKEHSIFQL